MGMSRGPDCVAVGSSEFSGGGRNTLRPTSSEALSKSVAVSML